MPAIGPPLPRRQMHGMGHEPLRSSLQGDAAQIAHVLDVMANSRYRIPQSERDFTRPGRSSLRDQCALHGHERGDIQTNRFGWSWRMCQVCRSKLDLTGPDGEAPVADE
jgi:hypothetical protein